MQLLDGEYIERQEFREMRSLSFLRCFRSYDNTTVHYGAEQCTPHVDSSDIFAEP